MEPSMVQIPAAKTALSWITSGALEVVVWRPGTFSVPLADTTLVVWLLMSVSVQPADKWRSIGERCMSAETLAEPSERSVRKLPEVREGSLRWRRAGPEPRSFTWKLTA